MEENRRRSSRSLSNSSHNVLDRPSARNRAIVKIVKSTCALRALSTGKLNSFRWKPLENSLLDINHWPFRRPSSPPSTQLCDMMPKSIIHFWSPGVSQAGSVSSNSCVIGTVASWGVCFRWDHPNLTRRIVQDFFFLLMQSWKLKEAIELLSLKGGMVERRGFVWM